MRTFSLGDNMSIPSGEIDLREETIRIVYGTGAEPPRGSWVIHRRSNTSQRSAFWNEDRKESIGGPPFEYEDYLMRARISSFTGGQDQEIRDVMAHIETPVESFYMDYRMRPKKEDYILKITGSGQGTAPSVFTVTAKYDILLVQAPKDQNGRIEYYKCICKKGLSTGDRTLENIVVKEIMNG